MHIGNKTCKFTTKEKNSILRRVLQGENQSAIAREYGVDPSAISHLNSDYGKPVKVIQQELQDYTIELEKEILSDNLKLLQKKTKRLLSSDDKLDTTRIDQISSVVNDSWKRLQVTGGNPTEITTTKNLAELQVFLNSHALSNLTPIDVLTLE